MNAYKVRVSVDGRDLESLVKEGILATIEVGKPLRRKRRPPTRFQSLQDRKGQARLGSSSNDSR